MAGVTQVSKYIKPLHWYSLGEEGEQGQREYSGAAVVTEEYSGDATGVTEEYSGDAASVTEEYSGDAVGVKQGQREYSGDAAGGKHEQRKYSGDAAGGKRPAEVRNRRVLQLLGNIINNNTPYTHRHVCRIIPVIPFLPHFPI